MRDGISANINENKRDMAKYIFMYEEVEWLIKSDQWRQMPVLFQLCYDKGCFYIFLSSSASRAQLNNYITQNTVGCCYLAMPASGTKSSSRG